MTTVPGLDASDELYVYHHLHGERSHEYVILEWTKLVCTPALGVYL